MSRSSEFARNLGVAALVFGLNACGSQDPCTFLPNSSVDGPKPVRLQDIRENGCKRSKGRDYEDIRFLIPDAVNLDVEKKVFRIVGREMVFYNFTNREIDWDYVNNILKYLTSGKPAKLEDIDNRVFAQHGEPVVVKNHTGQRGVVILTTDSHPLPLAVQVTGDDVHMTGLTDHNGDGTETQAYMRFTHPRRLASIRPEDGILYNEESVLYDYLLATELCNSMLHVGFFRDGQRVYAEDRIEPAEVICGSIGTALALANRLSYAEYVSEIKENLFALTVYDRSATRLLLTESEFNDLPKGRIFK
jgi:hypothetical protein